MTRRTPAVIIVVAMLTIGGCSQSDDSALAASTTTTSVGTPTIESTTALPSSTQAEATTSVAEVTPSDVVEPWDLVFISDSYGSGVADRYGEHAAEALGVPVTVHDHAYPLLSAAEALDHIKDDRYPPLADVVRDAEIIVIGSGPWQMEAVNPGWETCDSASVGERPAPEPYTQADWQPYGNVLDEIYNEIWRLREGEPTVLLAVDVLEGRISSWRTAGIEAECTATWESLSATIRDAAEANGATMVSLYDLFTGPDHQDDPREKGWIGPDGYHPSAAGIPVIADALAAAGFEPTTQP